MPAMAEEGYIQSKLKKTKETVDRIFDKAEKVSEDVEKHYANFTETKKELAIMLRAMKKEAEVIKKTANFSRIKKEIMEDVKKYFAEKQKLVKKEFEKDFAQLQDKLNKKFSDISKSHRAELFRESKKIIKDALQRSLNVHISMKDDKKGKKDYIF